MPFYIIFKKPIRQSDSKLLSSKNFVKLHKGLWVSQTFNYNIHVRSKVNWNSTIILKTSRKLQKVLVNPVKNVYDLGSLILIAYDLPPNPRVRKAVSRLIRRSPCFKLAPSIYLYPQCNYRKYEGTLLISPNILIKSVIVLGGRVICASRLQLLSPMIAEMLIEEFKDKLKKG